MNKVTPTKTEIVDRVVLVQDPILGSRYELQSVEIQVEIQAEDAPESESNEQ